MKPKLNYRIKASLAGLISGEKKIKCNNKLIGKTEAHNMKFKKQLS